MRGPEFAKMASFIEIAQRRSFAKAASHLGVSRSSLSQDVRALEEKLGVRLLNRTTRSVAPTEVGERLLARLRLGFAEIHKAVEEINESRDKPTGRLRLTVPRVAAHIVVAPMLARFQAEYPAIDLEVTFDDVFTDIVREGFDAGIRIGERIERDMFEVRLTDDMPLVAVASPDYLARQPAPKTPKDLRAHNCIRFRSGNGQIFRWRFIRKGKEIEVTPEGTLTVNDSYVVLRAVLDGSGIGCFLWDEVAAALADGRLVQLLKDWAPTISAFSLYYPSRRQVPVPLQAFIDFLRREKQQPHADTDMPNARPKRQAEVYKSR